MKFCQEHWEALKKAIDERGLTPFVAADGAEAVKRMTGESPKFEPLLHAHNAILSNTLRIAGLEVMAPNEDGTERCPLCFLIGRCDCGRGEECPFRSFITKAADEALEGAKHFGLIPSG